MRVSESLVAYRSVRVIFIKEKLILHMYKSSVMVSMGRVFSDASPRYREVKSVREASM